MLSLIFIALEVRSGEGEDWRSIIRVEARKNIQEGAKRRALPTRVNVYSERCTEIVKLITLDRATQKHVRTVSAICYLGLKKSLKKQKSYFSLTL